MKKKIFCGLCMILAPFVSFASEGVQYSLINTSSYVIPDPIHVTGGYITYSFSGQDTPAGCPTWDSPAQVNLDTIDGLPFSIYQGIESKFNFNIPQNLHYCFTETNYASANLVITEIDGINKKNGVCNAYSIIKPNSFAYANINIIKTKDNFYCESVNF